MLNDLSHPSSTKNSFAKKQQGSVLIEGLVSILIFFFAVIGIMGLQTASIQNAIQATYRSDASFFANQAIAQTMAGTFVQSTWQDEIKATLPNGNGTVLPIAVSGVPAIQVVVEWRLPSEAEDAKHNYTAVANVCLAPNSTTCI